MGTCGSEVTCTEIGLFKPVFIQWIVCLNGCLWQQLPVRDVPVGDEGPQESTQDVDFWSCHCCFLHLGTSMDPTPQETAPAWAPFWHLTASPNSLLFVHENSTKCLLSWVSGTPEYQDWPYMDWSCSQCPGARVGLGAVERPWVPGPAGDPALPNNGQQVVAHVHFITFGFFKN